MFHRWAVLAVAFGVAAMLSVPAAVAQGNVSDTPSTASDQPPPHTRQAHRHRHRHHRHRAHHAQNVPAPAGANL